MLNWRSCVKLVALVNILGLHLPRSPALPCTDVHKEFLPNLEKFRLGCITFLFNILGKKIAWTCNSYIKLNTFGIYIEFTWNRVFIRSPTYLLIHRMRYLCSSTHLEDRELEFHYPLACYEFFRGVHITIGKCWVSNIFSDSYSVSHFTFPRTRCMLVFRTDIRDILENCR